MPLWNCRKPGVKGFWRQEKRSLEGNRKEIPASAVWASWNQSCGRWALWGQLQLVVGGQGRQGVCHLVHNALHPGLLWDRCPVKRQGWPPILTPCCGCQPGCPPPGFRLRRTQGFGGILATAAGLQSWPVLRRSCRCPLSHLTHILPFNYMSRFPKAMPGTVQSTSWQRWVTWGAGVLPQQPPPLYRCSPALVLFIYYRFKSYYVEGNKGNRVIHE